MAQSAGSKREKIEKMVKIRYAKRFIKQLAKQPTKIQNSFYLHLELFVEDPQSPLLRNHALQGRLKGFYSINVGGDVRAIYEIIDDEEYMFQMISTHAQLYG